MYNLGDYQAIAKVPTPTPPTSDVDILFVIDNSPSMSEKQKSLVRNIPAFLQRLDDKRANYHIGIITTDVGSNVAPGQPWGGNIGKCDTFEGDDGVLQAVACRTRTDGTSDAKNACSSLCPDDRFVPSAGQRFISKVDGVTNVPVALTLDPKSGKMVDLGPSHAFQCMALVGDGGCGIESQLASARRALDGHRSENSGFLRNNSLLAVFFLTDEDDCSVQLARRSENNPATRDCSTPDQGANYDCYNVDYRCLARSVQCNEPMNGTGPKTGCKERPGNYLEPTSQYATFLRTLRPANRLLVSGIWTLPALTSGGKLTITRGGSGTASPFLNRASGLDASCSYVSDPGIFGQAQLRLSQFAKALGNDTMGERIATESSICDVDNYASALDQFAQSITAKLK